MAFVEPVILQDRGIRLEPLALAHEAGLAAAAADGQLWTLRVTSVPEPANTRAYIEAALEGRAQGHRFAFAVVDAASGVSGAGRAPKPTNTFNAVDEDFTAYGLLTHRHTPEIEQNLSHAAGTPAQVIFTPHLAPMNRGILATCYARPTTPVSTGQLRDALHAAYDHEPFVVVTESSPSTKASLGSNAVHVTAHADERTGWVLAIAALDNLTKGASGGAVQAANVALGLPETAGLPIVGLYP